MLILTRHAGEKVRIGDDVTIIVTKIHEGHISLGIAAPREMPVHRSEIYQRIEDEKARLQAQVSPLPRHLEE